MIRSEVSQFQTTPSPEKGAPGMTSTRALGLVVLITSVSAMAQEPTFVVNEGDCEVDLLDGLPGLIESSAPSSRMAKLSPWPTN